MDMTVFTCNDCNMKFNDKAIAQKCEDWCKKHKSCNLDIIKLAIKS